MKENISIITLGCSKNTVDSELIKGILSKNGYKLIDELDLADIIIVNTCGFIKSAKEESIENILEVSKLKENKLKKLYVAGCLGQRYKEELIKEIPEIDGIIGTGEYDKIINFIKGDGANIVQTDNINSQYLENIDRVSETPNYMSYIKIADGCDNHCTYCIIPKLRGRYRSRKHLDILKEAEKLARAGVKEVILIAQDTTRYGLDLYDDYTLKNLLIDLEKIEGIKWIRVLYLYPEMIDDSLIDTINNSDKIVSYLDIPIQHISNNVLRNMNRRTSKEEIIALINKLREKIDDIVIRSTLIIGFPGESDEDFNELKEFVKEYKIDKLGAFTYSKEEDTKAYSMKGHISEEIMEDRINEIMEIQRVNSLIKNKQKLGKKLECIIEEKISENEFIGRDKYNSPEIDGVIYIKTDEDLEIGQFVDVDITGFMEYDLIGEV